MNKPLEQMVDQVMDCICYKSMSTPEERRVIRLVVEAMIDKAYKLGKTQPKEALDAAA